MATIQEVIYGNKRRILGLDRDLITEERMIVDVDKFNDFIPRQEADISSKQGFGGIPQSSKRGKRKG